jgi:hypothetical protein
MAQFVVSGGSKYSSIGAHHGVHLLWLISSRVCGFESGAEKHDGFKRRQPRLVPVLTLVEQCRLARPQERLSVQQASVGAWSSAGVAKPHRGWRPLLSNPECLEEIKFAAIRRGGL